MENAEMSTATQNGKVVLNTFDAHNVRTQAIYPGSHVLALARDPLGRLTEIAEASSGTVAGYLYAGRSRRADVALGNDIVGTFTYDALARLAQYQWQGSTGPAISEHILGYDKASNIILDESIHNNGVGHLYEYDSLYRISSAALDVTDAHQQVGNPPATYSDYFQYQYDASHNFTNLVQQQEPGDPTQDLTTAFTINALNQYTTGAQQQGDQPQGTSEYLYDDNGNMIQDGIYEYDYNWRNLITEVRWITDKKIVALYTYDALGRRITKYDATAETLTQYLYDGWQVIEERDSQDSITNVYVYGALDQPVQLTTNSETYYYHYNHQGSVEALTDKDGAVVERYAYNPYGTVTITDAAGLGHTDSTVGNPYFYTARRLDPETGLYHYRNRYYSAVLGRFIQRDPLEYADSENLYEYVQGNPLAASDPFGLFGDRVFDAEYQQACGGPQGCRPTGPMSNWEKVIVGGVGVVALGAAAPVAVAAVSTYGPAAIAAATPYVTAVATFARIQGPRVMQTGRTLVQQGVQVGQRGYTFAKETVSSGVQHINESLRIGANIIQDQGGQVVTNATIEYAKHPQRWNNVAVGTVEGVLAIYGEETNVPPTNPDEFQSYVVSVGIERVNQYSNDMSRIISNKVTDIFEGNNDTSTGCQPKKDC